MIFADKLIELRKQNGWSQEELAEKCNVSRQSISKWEGALSVPELDKIILLSEVFGVSTDYLLRDDLVETKQQDYYEPTNLKSVSLDEANDFIKKSKFTAILNAIGVTLCILSPTLLIYLIGYSETGGMNENMAVGFGIAVLLSLVAIAVTLFIYGDSLLHDYKFISTDEFKLAYGVSGLANDLIKKGHSKQVLTISIGVALIILSPIPLIVFSIMEAEAMVVLAMVDVLLILVATAIFLFIAYSGEKSACDKLLQVNEYSIKEKYAAKKLGNVAGVYWMSMTGMYLGYSFVTMRWDISWIIWPVAGILFGIVMMIAKSLLMAKRDK